jgi:hypothetical protein
MTKTQVIELLESGVSSTRVEELVRAYGIAFEVTPGVEAGFREAGASDSLVRALREISPKPEPATPAAEVKPAAATTPPTSPPAATPVQPVLLVETTPPAAEVYIDEERVGKTGPEGKLKISTLAAGGHRVRVSSSGYEDFGRDVDLAAGTTTVVAVTLVAIKPAVVENRPAAGGQVPAGVSPRESPADIYKILGAMTGQTGEGGGDPNSKRFYVTHEHGKALRSLGYGGGGCYGWLIIGNGRVQFSSNDEDHAFDAAANEVSELEVKSNHVRFRFKDKKYHLMTQDMGGFFGGDSQGPGSLRKAFESAGVKAKQ